MFSPHFSSWKLYNEGALSYVFTLKNMWHWGWAQGSLTLKAKHKMK
jgi:hypothetical protein